MTFVTVRRIDALGRIVLPIDMRRFFHLTPGSAVGFTENGSDIVVRRGEDSDSRVIKYAVDALGRVVIPVDVRRRFRIPPHHALAILPMEDGIYLRLPPEP